jgi:hypothetical protein
MKYDIGTKLLRSDDSSWFKRLNCPLNKQWHELQRVEPSDSHDAESFDGSSDQHRELRRHCPSCERDVVDISSFDDRQVGALLKVNPAACVHASRNSRHITFDGGKAEEHMRGPTYSCSENTVGAPVVHTARTVYGINCAAKDGYWPLLKPVQPSARIRQKILVAQNRDGTISTAGDFRAQPGGHAYWYNPYRSPLPFAAYLIPPGLPPGTRVYLSDLIEDITGKSWNQGDSYRRRSAYAVWDGEDLNVEQEAPLGFVG